MLPKRVKELYSPAPLLAVVSKGQKCPPVFLIEREFGCSNLTIHVMYEGVYVCYVGRTNSTFNLDVLVMDPAGKISFVFSGQLDKLASIE